MKCEYENAIHKVIELANIIKNRNHRKAIWVNGALDKQVKNRLLTIGKILNTTKDSTNNQGKVLNIPVVRFSEERAEVCKRNEHWKECVTWTMFQRCIKDCDLHKQT